MKKEEDVLQQLVQEYGITFSFRKEDGTVELATTQEEWRIIPSENRKRFYLYHKNTHRSKEDSLIRGFHRQSVQLYSFAAYFEYVAAHVEYRIENPLEKPKKKHKSKPRKGTKRYRAEKRKAKEREDRWAIRNVLKLIESMSTIA